MLIEADGTFNIEPEVVGKNADKFIVYVSGVAGGAVLTLQHRDEAGNYIDLEDGVIASPSQNQVLAGRGAKIYIHVTGATGTTAVYVTVRGLI